MGHERDDIRLTDSMADADRDRKIAVSVLGILGRDKKLPRNTPENIKNGTVGAPVREITIASTLQRMLQDIVEVGADIDWLPMRAAGMSLVIRDVTMSGA